VLSIVEVIGQVLECDSATLSHDYSLMDRVSKLSYVSGPGITPQRREASRIQPFDLFALIGIDLSDQVRSQILQILDPVA
jgi:hypothetical protein